MPQRGWSWLRSEDRERQLANRIEEMLRAIEEVGDQINEIRLRHYGRPGDPAEQELTALHKLYQDRVIGTFVKCFAPDETRTDEG